MDNEQEHIFRATARILAWLEQAPPGAWTTYHTGFLMIDRDRDPAIAAVANVLLNAAAQGVVHLTQERLDKGLYHYYATRSPRTARKRKA